MVWLRLVLSGSIELGASSIAGEEVTVIKVPLGQWMPWYGCTTDRPAPHDLSCSAGTSCLALPSALVPQVAESHPQLDLPILKDIGARMQRLLEWTMQSVLLQLLLLKNQGITQGGGVLSPTQIRLARLAGCSRQSLSLLIRGLKQRRLIEGRYGGLRISDVAALRDFANEKLGSRPTDAVEIRQALSSAGPRRRMA